MLNNHFTEGKSLSPGIKEKYTLREREAYQWWKRYIIKEGELIRERINWREKYKQRELQRNKDGRRRSIGQVREFEGRWRDKGERDIRWVRSYFRIKIYIYHCFI